LNSKIEQSKDEIDGMDQRLANLVEEIYQDKEDARVEKVDL